MTPSPAYLGEGEDAFHGPLEAMPCATCEGRGMVSTVEYVGMHPYLSGMPCPDCNTLDLEMKE